MRHDEAPDLLPRGSELRSIPVAGFPAGIRMSASFEEGIRMDGFYTVKEVCYKLHISRETLRRWEGEAWFPKRVRFTQYARGRVAFLKSDVDTWIETRRTASQRPAA